MNNNESKEIYTNISSGRVILTHSKEQNTTGKNTANTVHDLILKTSNTQKKESE